MRNPAWIAAGLFLFAGLASAQVPSGNIFFGYSFLNTSSSALDATLSRPNLQGWEASFEGKIFPWIGIVGDVSGHYGSQNFTEPTPNGPMTLTVTGHEQEYLFGPRLSIPVGKFTPFGEVFVGFAHIHTGGSLPTPANTSWATAAGGGLDFRLIRFLALRVEGDYVRTNFFSTSQNGLRLSTGIVLRF